MLLRRLLTLTLLLGVSASAFGQIVAIGFEDEKAAKKYKHLLVDIRGQAMVVGEVEQGIRFEGNTLTINKSGSITLFVADPTKPEVPAYAVKDGERVPTAKKNRVSVNGQTVGQVLVLMREESLPGLAREYEIRVEQIDEIKAARDVEDKGSSAWMTQHMRVIGAMERLDSWLRSTGYAPAADKLLKELERERKGVREEAVRARAQRALASLEHVEPDPELLELSKQLSAGAHVFKAIQTQHLRIDYIDELPTDLVEESMLLGEEIIEGFRAEFVDPYVGEGYPERIPDTVFQRWLYVPDSDAAFEGYSHGFWGVDWTRDREERLAMGGGRIDGALRSAYRNYRRNRDLDLPGIVTHDIGHALAGLHYGSSGAIRQDWLSEAVGYYMSFEYLGRNMVTCRAFDHTDAGYVRRELERKRGDKTVGIGRRDIYNEVALTKGRPIDQLARKVLFEMDDADIAKSWSFFDYVAREEGKAGQLWLRAAGDESYNPSTFIANWRARAAEHLGVDPARAFSDLEERWKAYARGEQSVDDGPRRR
jgi:hypothetical protein